jgi:hypothetical protein
MIYGTKIIESITSKNPTCRFTSILVIIVAVTTILLTATFLIIQGIYENQVTNITLGLIIIAIIIFFTIKLISGLKTRKK